MVDLWVFLDWWVGNEFGIFFVVVGFIWIGAVVLVRLVVVW